MEIWNETAQKYGLTVNMGKAQSIRISKNHEQGKEPMNTTSNNKKIYQTEKYENKSRER